MSIYLLSQMDVICESYRTLTILPNKQKVKQVNSKKVNIDVIMLTWQCDRWKRHSGLYIYDVDHPRHVSPTEG
jgi:hypothetical protein